MEHEDGLLSFWLALHRSPHLGPNRARKLLSYFQSVKEIFSAEKELLIELGLKEKTIEHILSPDWHRIEKDLCWASENQHHVLTCFDIKFPSYLKEISACPLLLFVDGSVATLNSLQLSIVGSRSPTAAGRRIAFDLAEKLSATGFTITSGLALGIDAQSHMGALAALGKTVAVLGNGIDNIYPVRHRKLANRIKANGAVISEYPPSTPPLPQNFPQRNRIISGLSIGTLVVEATKKSGSLITAHLANEQGREVFAVPGSTFNPMSEGCHSLLKQGAKLTETVGDILDELNFEFKGQLQAPAIEENNNAIGLGLDIKHKNLLELIGFDPISIDSLVEQSGLTAEAVSSMLLNIELAGYIQPQLGGSYIRIVKT